MCGRAACSLDPDTLCRACGYRDGTGKQKQVSWVDSQLKYVPSYNLAPRDVLPCLVAGSHFQNKDERVLCAMMWGMIPPWHEGDYKKHTASTHNGRLETLTSSKLYGAPLRHGQRCIVVCDGFYEWQTTKSQSGNKQPYFIYSAQEKDVKADDSSTWNNEWSEETGWKGFKPLMMAGVFNKFKSKEVCTQNECLNECSLNHFDHFGKKFTLLCHKENLRYIKKIDYIFQGESIYSCTIITRESNSVLSWLHHRMPLFLTNDEDVHMWLDKGVSEITAVRIIKEMSLTEGTLQWHPVSTTVNKVSNKSEECIKEIKKSKPKSNTFLTTWLQKGAKESAKRKSAEEKNDGSDSDEKDKSKIMKKH